MLRSALIALAAVIVAGLAGGCRKTPEGEPIGSPGASVAGTETTQDDRSASSRSNNGRSASSSSNSLSSLSSLSSLIAVATTSASEAQPCEQVCGSLGDCLLADDDYTTSAAGGLELVCLDMCVHSEDSAPAKTKFLACGGQGECGPLQACAEQTWPELAAAHQGPELAGVQASADPCREGCRWTYACMQTGQPPDQAYLDPALQQTINECMQACDLLAGSNREYFAKLGECLPRHCSMEGTFYCYEEAMKTTGMY